MDDIETYLLPIEKGVFDGHKVYLHNSANDYVDKKSSDLIFTVKTKQHEFYKREGKYNLKAVVELSLKEALLGFKKRIRHLDGTFFEIKGNGVTQPGETLLLKGKGLPKHDYPVEKGNLKIEYKVKLPKRFVSDAPETSNAGKRGFVIDVEAFDRGTSVCDSSPTFEM